MRNLMQGLGAAAVVMAGAAHAADMPVKAPPLSPPPMQASGYVELYGGWATTKENVTFCNPVCNTISEKFDGWVLGGAGRGNYWFSPGMSMQLDAQAEGTSYSQPSPSSGHFSSHAYLVGGHFTWWRDPQRGLFGVVAGAGDAGGGFAPAMRHGLIGGEAQLYLNQFTFYVQGGYDTTLGTVNFIIDSVHAWFVRGTGRYFVTPNVKLEGTVLYADGEVEWGSALSPLANGSFTTWLWEAKAEARLGAHPFSVFAKYQGSQTKHDSLNFFGDTVREKITDHRVLVGLRLYLNEDTLAFNDRRGATLDIIDPLGNPSGPLMVPPSASGTNLIVISDARLKRDIELLARLDQGLGLYRYRYLWSDTVYVGVMAQEVADMYPAAVIRGAGGYLRVDYGSLGLKLLTLAEWNALTFGVH